MIKKTVEVEAKAGLQSVSYIREIDHRTQYSNYLAHVTVAKVQTQNTIIKDPRIEEPKPKAKDLKLANNSFGNAETSKKVWKKSKKSFQKEKCKQKNFSFVTHTTGGNTISNDTGPKNLKKDLSEITYYNCNKKGHYTWTCPKFKKDNCQKN